MIAWWRAKVKELVSHVPSFRGFLAKADSEGQPGPMSYNRTELQGANMFGDILDPLPLPPMTSSFKADKVEAATAAAAPVQGVAIWRSFSHPPGHPDGNHPGDPSSGVIDQALFQYERFAKDDGKFRDNVVLQNKNGPFVSNGSAFTSNLQGRLGSVSILRLRDFIAA